MEAVGKIRDVMKDLSGKFVISFEVDKPIEKIDGLLDITYKPHKEKRSLNANSYFHVLCGKIAQSIHTGQTEVKNRLIREYGQWEIIDGMIPTITMKAEYEDRILNTDGLHLKVISRDKETVRFGLMRGSSTYSTAEMSQLIDGTVNEAKGLDIEVLTPDQLERLKASWQKASVPEPATSPKG